MLHSSLFLLGTSPKSSSPHVAQSVVDNHLGKMPYRVISDSTSSHLHLITPIGSAGQWSHELLALVGDPVRHSLLGDAQQTKGESFITQLIKVKGTYIMRKLQFFAILFAPFLYVSPKWELCPRPRVPNGKRK